jgi:hypothetical protein
MIFPLITRSKIKSSRLLGCAIISAACHILLLIVLFPHTKHSVGRMVSNGNSISVNLVSQSNAKEHQELGQIGQVESATINGVLQGFNFKSRLFGATAASERVNTPLKEVQEMQYARIQGELLHQRQMVMGKINFILNQFAFEQELGCVLRLNSDFNIGHLSCSKNLENVVRGIFSGTQVTWVSDSQALPFCIAFGGGGYLQGGCDLQNLK